MSSSDLTMKRKLLSARDFYLHEDRASSSRTQVKKLHTIQCTSNSDVFGNPVTTKNWYDIVLCNGTFGAFVESTE